MQFKIPPELEPVQADVENSAVSAACQCSHGVNLRGFRMLLTGMLRSQFTRFVSDLRSSGVEVQASEIGIGTPSLPCLGVVRACLD